MPDLFVHIRDLLRWMLSPEILSGINASTTVVVAIFAFVQLRYINRERWDKRRAAYAALWIEQWRIYTVSALWNREDLITLAEMGVVEPEDILPRDWGASSQLLGELGMQTARFGGTAYAFCAHAATEIRNLKRLVAERAEWFKDTLPTHDMQIHLNRTWEPAATNSVKRARYFAQQAAVLFEDALKSAPQRLQAEQLQLKGLESDMAIGLEAEYAEHRKWLDRNRFGRIRLWLASGLRMLASRLAPPARD